jgi:uncharacterized protein YbaP (TraB family)
MFLRPPRKTVVLIVSVLFTFALLPAIPARAAQALPKCCVWRVTNAKAPFYLVGSIHALSKKDYPLPAPYEIALKDATRLLFEFNPTQHAEFETKFAAAAKYPPGQDLRSKIHPVVGSGTNHGGSPNISSIRVPTAVLHHLMAWIITSWIAPKSWEKK